jgi:hypothetical protein
VTTTRQPAYDAVYSVIRTLAPRSSDEYGIAVENARVWRAVEAALDAMGVPADRVKGSCPRCGVNEPENRWDVCNSCATQMGWNPPCVACKAEDSGEPSGALRHAETCGPGRSGLLA